MGKKSFQYKINEIEFNIKADSWIARLAARKLKSANVAIVIGKTIHLWNTPPLRFLQDKCWLRHELCHLRQFRKHGFTKFILLYLSESVRHGYFNNKFEIEAREAEATDN